jgi:RNA polymerase sigma factor (sigma-70 family)
MSIWDRPPEIRRVLAKPREERTPEDCAVVIEWIHREERDEPADDQTGPGRKKRPDEPRRPRLDELLRGGALVLRPLVNDPRQEAEDAWQGFCVQQLVETILRSDPERGDEFHAFLKFRFHRHCWQRRARSRKESSLPSGDLVEPSPPVGAEIEREEFVRKCLERLRPRERDAIRMVYFDERPLKEVAAELGMTLAYFYVFLHTVRRELREDLEREGIGP